MKRNLFCEMEIRIHYEICHKHGYIHNFSNSDLHIVNIHFRVCYLRHLSYRLTKLNIMSQVYGLEQETFIK